MTETTRLCPRSRLTMHRWRQTNSWRKATHSLKTMARNIKLKPSQPPRRYVSLDVTGTIDTLAFGQLWTSPFGWKNLLWELDLDKTDPHHRVDNAHPQLPVRWLKESLGKNSFTDTCVLPQGADGRGLDPLWAGTDADSNLTEMRAANA